MATECNEQVEHWVGVDVAKTTFDAALVRDGQRYPHTPLSAVPVRHFARTQVGAKELVEWLDSQLESPDSVRVCMEATGAYSTQLATWLLNERVALQPAIVNPARSCAFIDSLGLRNKTDQLDARALGFYGVERRPVAYEPPTKVMAELRALSRYRSNLVAAKGAESNRAGEPVVSRQVASMQKRRLRQFKRDVERLDTQIAALVHKTPQLKSDIDALTAIYGVGMVTAVVVLTEMGDLRRFGKARQLSAFAGMSPRIRQSGTSVNAKSHLCKQGNSRTRQALYMAAMTTIRGNNDLQRAYRRLLNQGKTHMAALGAVMRKLLCLMRAILISGKPYQAHFQLGG